MSDRVTITIEGLGSLLSGAVSNVLAAAREDCQGEPEQPKAKASKPKAAKPEAPAAEPAVVDTTSWHDLKREDLRLDWLVPGARRDTIQERRVEAAPEITIDEYRRAVTAAATRDAAGRSLVQEVFAKHGIKDITSTDPALYSTVMAELSAK